MRVEISGLNFSYAKEPVLKDINLCFGEGEVIALLGPNGAGKSTLFKCMLGFLKAQGTIRADGIDIKDMDAKERAGLFAYIPQSHSPVFNHSVIESVLMGITRKLALFEQPGKEHYEKAENALGELGIGDLRDRGCMKISGGERELMLLARALVQDAKVLLMDEPTANLDLSNSCNVMRKIGELGKKGYTVLFSAHDPNLALRYATRVIAIKDGGIIADGIPSEVLDEDVLRNVYSVSVKIGEIRGDGVYYKTVIPIGE